LLAKSSAASKSREELAVANKALTVLELLNHNSSRTCTHSFQDFSNPFKKSEKAIQASFLHLVAKSSAVVHTTAAKASNCSHQICTALSISHIVAETAVHHASAFIQAEEKAVPIAKTCVADIHASFHAVFTLCQKVNICDSVVAELLPSATIAFALSLTASQVDHITLLNLAKFNIASSEVRSVVALSSAIVFVKSIISSLAIHNCPHISAILANSSYVKGIVADSFSNCLSIQANS